MNPVLPDFISAESCSKNEQDPKPRYPGAFSSNEPTPYEKSGMAEGFVPSGLHNAREPYYAIQHEKGFHRLVAYMHVRGDTNREIAAELGRSEVNISNILRQPYVQEYIVDEVKRLGGAQVQTVLKGAALKAAQRLLTEIDNTNTGSAQSRIAAAKETLDRVFGKAPQSVTHFDGDKIDELSDEEIKRQLVELEQSKTN